MEFYKVLTTWCILCTLCSKKYCTLAAPVPNEESQSLKIEENSLNNAITDIPTDVKENLDGI